jgi:Domain of unknown function (DUF4173)
MRTLLLATAALAAALSPGAPPGIGVSMLAGLVVLAAVFRRGLGIDTVLFGGLAIFLAVFATVRDSGVVVWLDLVVAFGLASYAVCGPGFLAPLQPFASLPRIVAEVPRPTRTALTVSRGVGLGLAVAVPFAALFWSADAAFANLMGSTPLPDGASVPLRLVTAAGVVAVTMALRLSPGSPVRPEPLGIQRRLAPVEWISILLALNLLFAVFVGVQLTVLFAGDDHVLSTAGLTYAEYARSGYWQLLGVGILTFVVVGLAVLLGETRTRRLLRLRGGLLGLLIALTLVVLASAFHRLRIYENALGFTPLRLYVETSIIWFGAIFLLLLVAGAVPAVRRQLPRAAIAVTALGLVGFSISNPDARVADHNVARWKKTGRIDVQTLGRLSADAAHALDALPPHLRAPALAGVRDRSAETGGLAWNLARARAQSFVDRTPTPTD